MVRRTQPSSPPLSRKHSAACNGPPGGTQVSPTPPSRLCHHTGSKKTTKKMVLNATERAFFALNSLPNFFGMNLSAWNVRAKEYAKPMSSTIAKRIP